MRIFFARRWGVSLLGCLLIVGLSGCATPAAGPQGPDIHTWEMQEIVLQAAQPYDNYYADVDVWVDWQGPGFNKRVYGFWDGGNRFVVRLVAVQPGAWQWTSHSNQEDAGLNGHSGNFNALPWSQAEKRANPNRRGFVRATANGHALQYADGTPFFMLGDTWLAGSTWRLPYRSAPPAEHYQPGPGIGFEDAVQYRKAQGFNSVSMIAAFPNWDADTHPSTYADEKGIYLRNAWEKFGYDVADGKGTDASGGVSYWGTYTAKSMRDEYGNLPFEKSAEHPGVSNFDRINPAYFQSLDRKMAYLSAQGFVPLLETVRRDAGPSWNAYFDFNKSFARYAEYLIARYGAWNFIFSGIHLDWIPEDFSLTAAQFNAALTYHMEKYGAPPFGQIRTTLIDRSTYTSFGHGSDVPWMDMHSVGNKPRDHRVGDALEVIFKLQNPTLPAINFEPYYTGWHHEINKPAGEQPPPDSDRDNYFARAQMYGSVLSGGLSGHVHGTAAYDLTTTGEPEGARPHFWKALSYQSGNYMQYLAAFIQSEGAAFQQLQLASDKLVPHKDGGSPEDGLDGWSYMMRTPDTAFALLYFENKAKLPKVLDLVPDTQYLFSWYNPENGLWLKTLKLRSDASGTLTLPDFPVSERENADWAAKILVQ